MTGTLWSAPGVGGIVVLAIIVVGAVGSVRMLQWIVNGSRAEKGEE